MTLDAKELAHFIVMQGVWKRESTTDCGPAKRRRLRLEGIVRGKASLIVELDKLLPSMLIFPASESGTTSDPGRRGSGFVDLVVDESELARARLLSPRGSSAVSLPRPL
jgi:hypothetical protein